MDSNPGITLSAAPAGATIATAVLTSLTPSSTTRRNRDGNGGGPGSGGIASSAALYLYTFLATLVLLIAVSTAIVARSFVLRRRHRRLVEEAIRNGTWVPPTPTARSRRARVDLSKKPVMWEAYLGSAEKDSAPTPVVVEDVREWDAIKPVSAQYFAPLELPTAPGGADAKDVQVGSPPLPPLPPPRPRRTFREGMRALGDGLRSAWRWTLGLPPSPTYDDSRNGSVADLDGLGDQTRLQRQQQQEKTEMVVPSIGPYGGPPVVQVSVVIAMPQPPKTSSSSVLTSAPPLDSSSSGSLQLASTHPLSSSTLLQLQYPLDDEEPLPVMELGVAELVVVDPDVWHGSGKLKDPAGRDSASLSMTSESA